MNPKRFRGLQDVVETAEVVLWVTSGAKSGRNPDANITLGMSSTLRAERMDLRLQFLDVDDPSSIDPSMLAKMLLSLAFLDPSKTDKLLWAQEPELALKGGCPLHTQGAISRHRQPSIRRVATESHAGDQPWVQKHGRGAR
ncbi:hypothetical protein BJX76DRAFT_65867 [Aspergillus varians]